MNFLQSFDWMLLIRCFIVGGLICVIGQILIDKTKLTPARILVTFVTLGTILGGLGIYKYLVNFAGCGATVPLLGFGNNLAKGAVGLLIESNECVGDCISKAIESADPNKENSVLNKIDKATGLSDKLKSKGIDVKTKKQAKCKECGKVKCECKK